MANPKILTVDPLAPTEDVVEAAVQALRAGGIIALPSDTIYGLSCDAYSEGAVLELGTIKGHLDHRPFVVLFDGSTEWLDRLVPDRPPILDSLREKYWPGPLTLILNAGEGAPSSVVSERGGIALRYPNHPLSLQVLRRLKKPIVSTSANFAGEPPHNDARDIVRAFGSHLDLVLDAGGALDGLPSTIADLTGPDLRVLREGALALD
jgi:L-threonylcarbamoyladenylate synthase